MGKRKRNKKGKQKRQQRKKQQIEVFGRFPEIELISEEELLRAIEQEQAEAEETKPETEGMAETGTGEAEPETGTEEAKPETGTETIFEIKSKRGNKTYSWAIWSILQTLIILGLGFMLFIDNSIKKELTIEVGSCLPDAQAFAASPFTVPVFSWETDADRIYDTVDDYGVFLTAWGLYFPSVLHVVDTTPPVVETKSVIIYNEDRVQAKDFIANIEDASKTEVSFSRKPDYAREGEQEILLTISDAYGNFTDAEAVLCIIWDKEPPVISGIADVTITVGESVSYKRGVIVTDNCDEAVKLEVDSSEVDYSTPGDYTVVYLAKDFVGNECREEITVHVQPLTKTNLSIDAVNAAADRLLSELLEEDMTEYEKIKAIYWWCHDHIAYSDSSSKDSPEEGAYQGLVERRGDCYTYAMTAKFLLTQAGIKNMDIERIPSGNSMHYWNLVDIGEGWHHFDSCRRADGSTFFYKTDTEIKAYSNRHNGTHNYDPAKYPEIVT